jgi:DNA recombination protein RmuC
MQTHVLATLFGVVAGSLLVWLVLRVQLAKLTERLSARDSALDEMRKSHNDAAQENQTIRINLQEELALRSAAEERVGRISELELELTNLNETASILQGRIVTLTSQLAEVQARREEETRSMEKNLALLTEVRQEFGLQFKSLADEILEEKSKRFTEQNKINLDSLLKPLGEQITQFKQRVEETYEKESQQRVSLRDEIEKLRGLNEKMDQDAINLTNALTGQSKTLGNWGEFILEEILVKAGLIKDREYSVRQTLTAEDGRRSQPDVLINLPENRHLVIDSKINLTAYLQHCSSKNDAECELELKKHIAGIRKHLKELDLSSYQDHYKLNSLDFVLMFIPLEPAFIVAVRRDATLFDDAFTKRIVIVCPSTLLATMRTVRNIWRQEDQKRNVLEIATQSGALYDKFVSFVDDLKDLGVKLRQTQDSYDAAHNKLTSGKGNLIGRAERIRHLGARASKRLPSNLLEAALEHDEGSTELCEPGRDTGNALQPALPEAFGDSSLLELDQKLFQTD